MTTESARSITLNGKRFVSGLFWQALTRPRAYQQEAREIGRQYGMDVVAIRATGRVLQAGFASRSPTNVGAYSIASTLAGMLGDNWIGVFAVDSALDEFLIVGTKNGGIIPGCDVIGSHVEIQERLNADYNLHHFERVFCPEGFGFEGKELQLEEVVAGGKLRKEYKLAPLSSAPRRRTLVLAGVAVLIVGLAAAGWLALRQHKDSITAAAGAAAQATQHAAAAVAAQAQQVVAAKAAATPPPHPWATQPFASSLRSACVDAIDTVPISMGGWLVDAVDCNGSSLQLVFKRSGNATIDSITQAATAIGYAIDQVEESGENAHLSRALPALPPGGDEPLATMPAVMSTIKSTLQRRQITVSIAAKPAPPPPPTLAGETPPPTPAPDWQTSVMTITGAHAPGTVMAGLEQLPGLRLITVAAKRNNSTLEWTLTGEINGK